MKTQNKEMDAFERLRLILQMLLCGAQESVICEIRFAIEVLIEEERSIFYKKGYEDGLWDA
jgi:hypothetical protein